ncbi:MAG: hypothetical protein IKF96_02040 [Eggerthellaceae bacterium]|nr:hypothetical protein [Eggerthellaceae bacterium]
MTERSGHRPSVSERAKPTRRTRDTRKRVTKASAPLVIKSVEQAAAEEAQAAAEMAAVESQANAVEEAKAAAAPAAVTARIVVPEVVPEVAEDDAAKTDDLRAALSDLPEVSPVGVAVPEEAPAAEEAPTEEPFADNAQGESAEAPESSEAEEPAESDESIESAEAEPAPRDRRGVPVYRAPSADELADADIAAWSVTTPEAEREQLLAEQRARDERRARTAGAVFKAILAFFIVMAVVLIGFLSWERWYAHDDIADFQGTWNIQGEAGVGHPDVNIRITEDKMILDINTTYGYTLDTAKKTITFTFQDLSGEGHYRFSADRRYLLITDGHYTWLETCLSDFKWQLECWRANFYGTAQPELGDLEGATLLYREY